MLMLLLRIGTRINSIRPGGGDLAYVDFPYNTMLPSSNSQLPAVAQHVLFDFRHSLQSSVRLKSKCCGIPGVLWAYRSGLC